MAISVRKLTFHCSLTSRAHLPGYLGSTLRGGLGWALKKISCALPRQRCADCMLREQCGYAWIFEARQYPASRDHVLNVRPHPFILQPNQTGSELSVGDQLCFDLHLFGRGSDYLPRLVYAVSLMGESGIGSGRRYGCGRFTLQRVSCNGSPIFNGEEQVLLQSKLAHLVLAEPEPADTVQTVRVALQTPLRLKRKNGLLQELPFAELIRACLRRISALEAAYGPGEPALDYKGLISRAGQVATVSENIRWQKLFRWSNRQKKRVSLSGMAGCSVYRGKLAEFLPLLQYAGQVNIGKQTVFGLGKITTMPQEQC